MSQRSFNESFLERLEKLCQKYENIEDKSDDTIDLVEMKVSTDKGKTKKMNKVKLGSLYTYSYKRNKDIEIKKANIIGRREFDDLYHSIFSYSFDDLYNLYCKQN